MSDNGKKITTGDRMVQMFLPPAAKTAQELVLHGVGYFRKGELLGQTVSAEGKVSGATIDRDVAAGVEKRKKGPRIATAEDVKSIERTLETARKTPPAEQKDPAEQSTAPPGEEGDRKK
jgi:hypothetical protein